MWVRSLVIFGGLVARVGILGPQHPEHLVVLLGLEPVEIQQIDLLESHDDVSLVPS